jgi:hypothetical protein
MIPVSFNQIGLLGELRLDFVKYEKFISPFIDILESFILRKKKPFFLVLLNTMLQ